MYKKSVYISMYLQVIREFDPKQILYQNLKLNPFETLIFIKAELTL